MCYRTEDPDKDFDRWDADQERAREQLPVCADCGEPVMEDHYFLINDEVICPDCLDAGYRKWTDEYIA